MSRKLVILTEGHTDPHTAKTASCIIRYRRNEVVALLDSTQAGKTTQDLLAVGGDLPVVATLDEAAGANTLLLGIAPPGGKIPPAWRPVILAAISRGMDVVGGLHDFLTDNPDFVAAAEKHGVTLTDVRKNEERDIARRVGIRNDCLRVLTVGNDCSVGKMLTSVELTNALKQRGHSTKFIATGQTGIMIEGDGCPIDRVISDFVSGAVEKMILAQQHHDILIVEGQGSLVHPSYSAVTLGLLHGGLPQAMIMCYEVGRHCVTGVEHVKIPPLAKLIELNEVMASITQPSRVIGIAMNSRRVNAAEAEAERERVRAELGLPVCDVIRHGPDELVDAILKFKDNGGWKVRGGVNIMHLKIHEFDLPLAHTFTISRESITVQKTLIVELEEDGYRGYGEATTNRYYGFTFENMAAALERVRGDLESRTLEDPVTLWQQLHPKLKDNPFAQCALDQAAHDLWGKKLGQPVYRLWGLELNDLPPTDYTIGIDEIDVMVTKMQEFPNWPVYKIKLGTPHDLDIVRALREHTASTFRVDANCGWSAEETIRNSYELKLLNVEFIEQPLPADQDVAMERVYRESVLPLIADESCLVESDVDRCVNRFHGINIKLVKCGGLTPARRMIERARELGLQVMVGCMTESTVGISAIAQLLPLLDYVDMDGALLLAKDIATGVTIEQGKCNYPSENGCGVKLI